MCDRARYWLFKYSLKKGVRSFRVQIMHTERPDPLGRRIGKSSSTDNNAHTSGLNYRLHRGSQRVVLAVIQCEAVGCVPATNTTSSEGSGLILCTFGTRKDLTPFIILLL